MLLGRLEYWPIVKMPIPTARASSMVRSIIVGLAQAEHQRVLVNARARGAGGRGSRATDRTYACRALEVAGGRFRVVGEDHLASITMSRAVSRRDSRRKDLDLSAGSLLVDGADGVREDQCRRRPDRRVDRQSTRYSSQVTDGFGDPTGSSQSTSPRGFPS